MIARQEPTTSNLGFNSFTCNLEIIQWSRVLPEATPVSDIQSRWLDIGPLKMSDELTHQPRHFDTGQPNPVLLKRIFHRRWLAIHFDRSC